MKRNTVISIVKALAIILMVIGHAEAPELVTNFIYTFHMPVFFICAGYFFNRKYLSDPWTFISKRIKGLYFPFVKWSLLFLLLHNVWFHLGVLNEQYGNWTGGVTHPYTFEVAMRRLVLILTSMSGYDEFMAGAFWFFRGLLVASVMFLLVYKLLEAKTPLKRNNAVLAVMLLCVGFIAFRIAFGVKLSTIPNGGWRETWGIFLFGVGVLYRQMETVIKENLPLLLTYFLLLCGAAWLHLSGMNNGAKYQDLLTLPITGTIGFLMLHHLAGMLDSREGRIRDALLFIGDNTLYIFIFHIISFKLVSLMKIWWYDLDFGQIGCHMVIHYRHTDFFWVIYSVVGVAVPVLALYAVRRMRAAVSRFPAPSSGA